MRRAIADCVENNIGRFLDRPIKLKGVCVTGNYYVSVYWTLMKLLLRTFILLATAIEFCTL